MRSEVATTPVGQADFRPERLVALDDLRDHFWFAGRRELVDNLLSTRVVHDRDILDVGCGTGSMLVELHGRGARVTGIDLLPDAVELSTRACPEARVLQAASHAIPLADSSIDGIVLLDVLEHVDEAATLAELSRILRAPGWLLVTVPAGAWLWSYRDDDAGHRRRYSRRRLERALSEAGFVVEQFARYQCLLLPVVVVTRVLGRRSTRWRDREERVPRTLNAVLTAVNRVEGRVASRLTLPWGTSLAVIARKRT